MKTLTITVRDRWDAWREEIEKKVEEERRRRERESAVDIRSLVEAMTRAKGADHAD